MDDLMRMTRALHETACGVTGAGTSDPQVAANCPVCRGFARRLLALLGRPLPVQVPDRTCGSCRFWEPLDTSFVYEDVSEWGSDDGVEVSDGRVFWSSCRNAPAPETGVRWPWGVCQRQGHPGAQVFSQDSSNYGSSIRTQSVFGCLQWDPKADLDAQPDVEGSGEVEVGG